MRKQIWSEVCILLKNKALCHLISNFLLQPDSGGSSKDSWKLEQTNHWLWSSLRSSASLLRTSLSLSASSPPSSQPRCSHGHSFVCLFPLFLVLLGHNSFTRGADFNSNSLPRLSCTLQHSWQGSAGVEKGNRLLVTFKLDKFVRWVNAARHHVSSTSVWIQVVSKYLDKRRE